MVGVSWSNGCAACRARHKGCSEERPGCAQCQKRGVSCPGYARELKLVMVHPGRKKAASTTSSSYESPASVATILGHPISQTSLTVSSAQTLPTPLLFSFIESAIRTQTRCYFLDSYLPSHAQKWPKLDTDLSVAPATGWLQASATMSSTDTLLDNALTALTLAHLERLEKHRTSYQSSAMYSKAMAELSKRLRLNQADCMSDTTLAGVMVLTLYEMQEERAKGWLSHVRGAASLVKLRGDRNFTSAFSQNLFLGSQMNELLHAVGRRKRMPPTADWSRSHSSTEPPPAIQLFDIIQELPSIIEYADAINSSTPGAEDDNITNHLLALTGRAQTFELRMADWYSRLERHQAHQRKPHLYWPEPSTLYNRLPRSHPGRIFSHFFCFPNMSVAEQIVLHWTALLFIPRLLRYTQMRLKKSGELPSSYPLFSGLDTLSSDPIDLALKIAQSLEYFLHPDVGLVEMVFVGFPMNLSIATCISLELKEVAFFGVVRARLREMNTGLGDFLDAMMAKGGGMEAVRLLVS